MHSGLPATLAALLTPFDTAGHLDVSRYDDYLPWLEQLGVDGHFVFGTTGEGLTLTREERERGLEAVLRRARKPVLVNVAALAAEDTRHLLAHAADVGARAAALVTPAYYTHDAATLVHYFAAMAAGARLPLLLYTIPSHAVSDLTPEAAASLLAATPAYVGIKDSSRNPNRLYRYLALGLDVFVGAESLVQLSTLAGGGSITAMAAAFPDVVRAVVDHAGDASGAALQAQCVALHAALRGPSIPALREVVKARGVDVGPPRLPFRPLTDEEARAARALAQQADQVRL
jgi:4-hydroxy-tetrahydrodipicolinate synthase